MRTLLTKCVRVLNANFVSQTNSILIFNPVHDLTAIRFRSFTTSQSLLYFNWWYKSTSYLRSLIYDPIKASSLRREPKINSKQGLERAHVLSIFLVVRLWKVIYGHEFISVNDRKALRSLLRRSDNFELVCTFANRTLHVKYDQEIAKALMNSNEKVSCGAKKRLKKIIQFLNDNKEGQLKYFVKKSIKKLKSL